MKSKTIAHLAIAAASHGVQSHIREDLRGLKIPSQNMPIRMNHDVNKGVGHTESIKVITAADKSKHLVESGLISQGLTIVGGKKDD